MAWWRVDAFAIDDRIGRRRPAHVVAQERPSGVLDAMRETGLDHDPLQRLECLGHLADRDDSTTLEDDQGVLRARMAVPVVGAARVDLHLAHRERRGPEVAGLDEQAAADAALLDDPGQVPSPDGLVLVVPATKDLADATRVGVGRGQQGEGVDRALVPDEVILRGRLVEDVAGVQDRSALEVLAMLEDDLAAGHVDDRLDAVTMGADLGPRRDPVELEADRHLRSAVRQRTGASRPAAPAFSFSEALPDLAAFAFSDQAARTTTLCGRIGQCPSRLPISSQ